MVQWLGLGALTGEGGVHSGCGTRVHKLCGTAGWGVEREMEQKKKNFSSEAFVNCSYWEYSL